MAKLRAEDTLYMVGNYKCYKIHIKISLPIRICFLLHVNECRRPLSKSLGLAPLPQRRATCWCRIWIRSVNEMDFHGCGRQRLEGISLASGQREAEWIGSAWKENKNKICVRQREPTQTPCKLESGVKMKTEREGGDVNTTALSLNSEFPAAWINILHSEQNVSRSGSAEGRVNSHKLGKLGRLLRRHL